MISDHFISPAQPDLISATVFGMLCTLLHFLFQRYKANLSMLVGKNVIMDTAKVNCEELKDYQELINHASKQYNAVNTGI